MGLILDTSEFVAADRSRQTLRQMLFEFGLPDEEFGISVVTVAELQHGIRRAETSKEMDRRSRILEDALSVLAVYPLSIAVALRVGTIDADLAMRGERLDFADLAIASTALELDATLATSNFRHFRRVPGLRILATRES